MSYRFAVRILRADPEALKVLSTLDRSQILNGETEIMVGRDDLTVIKNRSEGPADIECRGLEMRTAGGAEGRLVFRPSRQDSFTLYQGKTQRLTLGGGESLAIRSDIARNPTNGQVVHGV